ncbi:MAG: N-acetylneuraminate synthase family protein [Desulfococcaceae bacterium]
MKRAQIIAEVGANHGGDMALAERMIAAAAQAGADWVKFQSWRAETLPADYPAEDVAYYEKCGLSDEDHHRLIRACADNGVRFLTTCFDRGRVDFLSNLDLDAIKVASPDLGGRSLLRDLRSRFPRLIVSTGMAHDEEVFQAAETLAGADYTFLHCVSLYPTPPERVNMARMDWLRTFTPSVGFSDHTLGTEAAKLAIARGADFVEKHFTISRDLPGRDQAVSAEPDEIKEIADYAKAVAERMGTAHPGLTDTERELRGRYIGKWGDNR